MVSNRYAIPPPVRRSSSATSRASSRRPLSGRPPLGTRRASSRLSIPVSPTLRRALSEHDTMPPPDERTPLVQTVVVTTARPRYPHHTIRRICTVALLTILVVLVALFLVPTEWFPGRHTRAEAAFCRPWSTQPYPHEEWPRGKGLDYEDLKDILLSTPDEEKAKEWSRYYTSGPHLAGRNISQAIWAMEKWKEFGIDASVVTYDCYLNTHLGHRLALLEKKSDKAPRASGKANDESSMSVRYECSLEEDVLEEDPTTGLKDRVPTYHGYSANGNVTAQYVYVNHGSYQDYEDLRKAKIELEGKIAIVKYGGVFRGLKVKRAQELGMIGIVIYTDPEEDGEITEENGYKPYPHGPARNPSSVQRGSTHFLSMSSGDPTTPGYPSKPGVPRQDPHGYIPSIPSIPISYRDALPLLKALNGYGPKASDFNEYWQGGGLRYKGVEYNIGPSPPTLLLNLVNEEEYTTLPFANVIGIINGTSQDEVVVLGNHHDAWIAGGAGDPNSGSAAMMEVVRSFGVALEKGWKPLRTIVFASWDGEELSLVGSTEWVEEYIPWLSKSAVAYLNLDVGAVGPDFKARASPLLKRSLEQAVSIVPSPNQTVPGQTIGDLWDGHIATMGSGSDFAPFQDFAGIPSNDFGFARSPDSPIYHYHSNYDSFHWMEKYGDPGWHYQATIAKLLAVFAASLVESPIINFNVTDYAVALDIYLDHFGEPSSEDPYPTLRAAVARLHNAALAFDAKAARVRQELEKSQPWWSWCGKTNLWYEARDINNRYKLFERKFLYEKGLDERDWFKHVVFAPGIWTGYSGATFPGLTEGIAAGDQEKIARWTSIIEAKILDAAQLLE